MASQEHYIVDFDSPPAWVLTWNTGVLLHNLGGLGTKQIGRDDTLRGCNPGKETDELLRKTVQSPAGRMRGRSRQGEDAARTGAGVSNLEWTE